MYTFAYPCRLTAAWEDVWTVLLNKERLCLAHVTRPLQELRFELQLCCESGQVTHRPSLCLIILPCIPRVTVLWVGQTGTGSGNTLWEALRSSRHAATGSSPGRWAGPGPTPGCLPGCRRCVPTRRGAATRAPTWQGAVTEAPTPRGGAQ